MSDIGYFTCLVISIIFAVVALVALQYIIRGRGAYGWSIALAFSCSFGFVFTLPFRSTREIYRLPMIAGAFFAGVVLSAVLCCLCRIMSQSVFSRGVNL
jgi:hypothetical protein